MNVKRILHLSLLSLLILGICVVQAALPVYAATAQNPILWADAPDPDVIRVGNAYYMVSTTMHFNPGVPVMKSTDLVNWEIVNYVYDTLESGDKQNLNNGQNEYGQGSWASSLRYKNGRFYVVFASLASGRTYIYQTTNIESGPWTRSVLNSVYHDPSLLLDDDGRAYLIYGGGDIRIIELTADVTAVRSGGLNRIIIPNAGAIAGSGGLAAEGAHAYKINGRYYVFLISWPSGSMRTELVYRADSLTGTYQGQVALRNSGIAQGGVVDTPDGRWYAMLFRDYGSVGRIPYLVPTTWSNGWPVMGDPFDTGISVNLASKYVGSDEFNSGSKPGLMWQWNHNPDNSFWSLTGRAGYLRLTNGSVRSSILTAKNTLTQRTFGPESSAMVALETGTMRDGDYAGLAAFQYYYGFVGVKMVGTSKSLVMVRGSTNSTSQTSTPVEVASIPLSQSRVYLKVYTDYRNRTDKAYFYYSLDGSQWTALGSTLQMAYTMPHFVGYRFGLFTYATRSTGGSADFDYFRIQAGNGTFPTPSPAPTNTPSGPTATPTSTPSGPTATPTGTPTPTNLPGTIQVENYDSGGEGVAYHDTDATNSGGAYRPSDGVDIETTTDSGGGHSIGWTQAGEWTRYTANVATAGTYTAEFRVASDNAGASFHLEVDGTDVTGSIAVPNTGGWQTWQTVTRTGINLSAGRHVLRLVIDGAWANYNWMAFQPATTPTATPIVPTTPPTSTPIVPTTPPTATPAGPTATPASTPTPGGSTPCSPVSATITAPFTYDGTGSFCWQIATIPSYINSWNLDSLTVNGVSFSNIYAAPSSLPAKINGYWYISYTSSVAWGHFEAK